MELHFIIWGSYRPGTRNRLRLFYTIDIYPMGVYNTCIESRRSWNETVRFVWNYYLNF